MASIGCHRRTEGSPNGTIDNVGFKYRVLQKGRQSPNGTIGKYRVPQKGRHSPNGTITKYNVPQKGRHYPNGIVGNV